MEMRQRKIAAQDGAEGIDAAVALAWRLMHLGIAARRLCTRRRAADASVPRMPVKKVVVRGKEAQCGVVNAIVHQAQIQ
jgi:hypothetical protein